MTQDAPLHRPSIFPASGFEHRGRHYCVECTTSVDDFTAYVDWPCRTARALSDGSAVAAPLEGEWPEGTEWPDGMEMIRQVREALGMFAGAMSITPKVAWEQALERARGLAEAITKHHERIKTLGVNNTRDKPQWGGPWDHELWATVGLPSGPEPGAGGT